MRRFILSIGLISSFFLAACSDSGKDISPTSSTPPLGDTNPSGTGALPGSSDDTSAETATDPLASDNPSTVEIDPDAGDLPTDQTPVVLDTEIPLEDTDLPADLGDVPTDNVPIPSGATLPTTWGSGEPLFGSAFTVDTFPTNQIVSGGPGKDGIPALNNPPFVAASGAANWLNENDLVLGVVSNGVAKAYPHNIWLVARDRQRRGGRPGRLCHLLSTDRYGSSLRRHR